MRQPREPKKHASPDHQVIRRAVEQTDVRIVGWLISLTVWVIFAMSAIDGLGRWIGLSFAVVPAAGLLLSMRRSARNVNRLVTEPERVIAVLHDTDGTKDTLRFVFDDGDDVRWSGPRVQATTLSAAVARLSRVDLDSPSLHLAPVQREESNAAWPFS
jgi:hypothetical protein